MLLTIYTPTYNRENLLPRLYESLCNQTNKNFKWLVIDDGSTDNTKEIIAQWSKESPFEITYIYKKNGGVHTARDLAYSVIDTELLVGIDSDDYAFPLMVENVYKFWNARCEDDVCGIIAPYTDEDAAFFQKIKKATYQELIYKYKQKELCIIVRSDLMKKIPNAPVFKGETLVGEGFKWIQLPNKPFILSNQVLTKFEYQNNGYSQNAKIHFFKNLNGRCAGYNQGLKDCVYFFFKIRYCIKYIVTCMFLDKSAVRIIKESKNKLMTLLFIPLGMAVFFYYKKMVEHQISPKIKND